MSFARKYIKLVDKFLPSPFVIAILLTAITFLLALVLTDQGDSIFAEAQSILGYWQTGFWELLAFTMQMVLILLLGHTLALSPLFSAIIKKIAAIPKSTSQAGFLISFFTILMSFFNWGLCLVFGAILSRRIGEKFTAENKAFNYGILGAAGYSGMMVWHGGLSGSAPLKVAETKHFLAHEIGVVSISETLFSNMNIVISLVLIVAVPGVFYVLGKYFKSNSDYETILKQEKKAEINRTESNSAEDKAWIAYALGFIMLISAVFFALNKWKADQAFMDLNYINFLLLTFGIILHGSLSKFMTAVNSGIQGVSGIVIQFPLYSGIMGIMKYSGLVILISDFFVSISTQTTFPILTFFSAGLVNFFVPSGGGQWAVQGPIVVEAAQALNIPIYKIVMALAYGDQITNMLQPFWALPLLGITQLKAKDILPYSLFALLVGAIIFIAGLLLF